MAKGRGHRGGVGAVELAPPTQYNCDTVGEFARSARAATASIRTQPGADSVTSHDGPNSDVTSVTCAS